jgi:hypothetical protein
VSQDFANGVHTYRGEEKMPAPELQPDGVKADCGSDGAKATSRKVRRFSCIFTPVLNLAKKAHWPNGNKSYFCLCQRLSAVGKNTEAITPSEKRPEFRGLKARVVYDRGIHPMPMTIEFVKNVVAQCKKLR